MSLLRRLIIDYDFTSRRLASPYKVKIEADL